MKNKLFGLPVYMIPTIFALALPTIMEQIMQTAVQYIDTAMVGSLGTDATAAVGSTTTIYWLIGSTVSAIGVGFLAYISRAIGAGDSEKAKKASAQAVLAVIVSGIFFTVLACSLSGVIPSLMQVKEHIRPVASRYFLIIYLPMLPRAAITIFGTVLRSAGDTKTPMKVGIAVNVINVVLNFFFIYPSRTADIFGLSVFIPGVGMGVIGAAAASAVSFVVGGIIITAALFRHPVLSPVGYSFKPDREVLIPCFRVALPNGLQRFGTCLGYVVFAAMINSLGETSTATHTIANTVESAFYIPGYGMQTAAATLSGNALGARDRKKLSDLSKMIIPIEVLLMIITGGLLFLTAPYAMRIFSDDPEVISLGATVLRMVALSEPFYGVSIIIEGIMMGVGKTVMPFVTNITGMWAIRIVGTFICTVILGYGLVSAWACMILHNIMLFVVFCVYFTSQKWNPFYEK